MSNISWSCNPELKTTGIVNKFTQKLEYEKYLSKQELGNFLNSFKILSHEEIINLYYGEVYRIKDISSNHLVLKTKRRSGSALHYIDCKYYENLKTIKMEIKTSNSAAYFYIFWPLIIMFILTIFGNTFNLNFSIIGGLYLLFYSAIAILIGIILLKFSIDRVKNDTERAMYKMTGLCPQNKK
jgi:hypothetical protein